MYIIKANNINEALVYGITAIQNFAVPISSRVGDTLEIPSPVTTVYNFPRRKALISRVRDANPFFHLMEAMWILAGRQDVKFLTIFNKRMVEFSDDKIVFNAAYGYRMRNGVDQYRNADQISKVIETLRRDPNSRQAVIQIWDEKDLGKQTLDKACNMSVVFRVRENRLDMTVNNRSNDMIWGAYGANVVQFSILHEYVAASIKKSVGTYYQVSNSFHIYTDGPGGEVWDRLLQGYPGEQVREDPYSHISEADIMSPHFGEIDYFDKDLKAFFRIYDDHGIEELLLVQPNFFLSSYFKNLITPMLNTFLTYKRGEKEKAFRLTPRIKSLDWQIATQQWIINRI